MNKFAITLIIILVVIGSLVGLFLYGCEDDWCYVTDWQKVRAADSFVRCEQLGFPVMESFPRQCKAGGKTFVEVVEPILPTSYKDLISVTSPLPGAVISSPVKITGSARGNWYFEASFPIILTDWDGLIIAQGIATAKSDPIRADGASPTSNGAGWMTTEFVPFEATLIFTADKDAYSNKGTLILRKDNPSGLPQNDDALEIPVVFEKTVNISSKTGTLSGGMTIGPICPVERIDQPCNPTAEMYAARKISVWTSDNKKLIATITPNANGKFSIELPEGAYSLSMTQSGGVGGVTGLPASVVIKAGTIVSLSIDVDTGIR